MEVFSCAVRGKVVKICTGCKSMAYCGMEHQRVDWRKSWSLL
jgi:hypothetical protein